LTDVELVVDARAQAGESPWWCASTQTLLWVDIHGCSIHRFDPATRRDAAFDAPDLVGFVATHRQGGLVVALRDRVVHADRLLRDFVTIAVPPLQPGQRLNDGTIDATGCLWIGALDPTRPGAALFRIDRGGRCETKVTGLRRSNGLAFSTDGRVLYLSDSHPDVRTVWAFDVDIASGALANRRVFVDTHGLPGRPDGACVDAEDHYWMAAVDGGCLLRFAPDGGLVDRIAVPVEKPSKPAFGGGDLQDLYVTSLSRDLARPIAEQPHAGGLFRLRASVKGAPLPDCAIDLRVAAARTGS